jgi:hypothetical protein
MTRNAILDELHAARRQILADYEGDTAAYLRDAQTRLEASGRPIAHRPQRTLKNIAAVKTDEISASRQPSSQTDG